jgi:HEAT repeat protein
VTTKPVDDPVARAAAAAALGHRGRLPAGAAAALSEAAAGDPDGRVRAAALGALARRGAPSRVARAWSGAVADPDPSVRRRACELVPVVARRAPSGDVAARLVARLDASEMMVVEAAAWALGELGQNTAAVVEGLAANVTGQADPLVREAAVAALGALGDRRGLPAVLAACDDVPAVRRRAVLALAPFEGAAVDAALERARTDRDWQVRQAAEDLLGDDAPSGEADD